MSAVVLPAWPPIQLDLAPPGSAGALSRDARVDCPLVALFARVQDGDQAAFSELHAQTEDRLHNVVYRVLRSVDLVEDVVQDSYLQIWRHRHRFEPGLGSVMGWMSTIAHRRAVDRVRAVRCATQRDARYVAAFCSTDNDHQTVVVDAVHAAVVASRAMGALTAVEREALVLTYWGGQTAAEAARLLGVPVPTLKSRIRSARLRLRVLLDPHQQVS